MGLYWINGVDWGEIDGVWIVISGVGCAVCELYSGDMDNIVGGVMYVGGDVLYGWATGR